MPSSLPFEFEGPDSVLGQAAGRPEIVVEIPATVRSKRKLLRLYQQGLQLPEYFGWNWDGLEECLRDLSWLPGMEPITLRHASLPLRLGSESQRAYLELLKDLCKTNEPAAHRLRATFPERCRKDLESLLWR